MKGNSSVFFQLKPCIRWTKTVNQIEILRLLSSSVKIHQIPRVMFETTTQFFFKRCITLQCYER